MSEKIEYIPYQKIGDVEFIQEIILEKPLNPRKAVFRCPCKNLFIAAIKDVKDLGTKSCGCKKREGFYKTHGMSNSKEYNIFRHMWNRCTNPKSANYSNYGGRGIKVCERWRKFENFIEDIGIRPGKEYSLERIDVNKDYCSENCKWATREEQQNNKRTSRIIQYKGERKTLAQWSRVLEMDYGTLHTRLKSDNNVEKAFETPLEAKFLRKSSLQ